ncbi:MAG: transcriptional regulator [Flavobacterium sp. BFFFF2]|nr:MAG: transcriptional regulator [Flavobacterium sp. BFFFF2]
MKNNLRVWRAIAQISQDDLGQKIGVSRQTIYAIEKDKYVPSTELALKLAKYFNTTVEHLFKLDDDGDGFAQPGA